MRREALRHNWEICPPKYDVNRYRDHYFLNDFDDLKEKFMRNSNKHEPTADEFGNKTIQDFIPHKVAVRLRDTIKFTVMLDARAPDLKMDD